MVEMTGIMGNLMEKSGRRLVLSDVIGLLLMCIVSESASQRKTLLSKELRQRGQPGSTQPV